MEHSQDVDVVSPDDVENSIGSLRHHSYLEQVGTGDDNADRGNWANWRVRLVIRWTMRSA